MITGMINCEFFWVTPEGPYFSKKDNGYWTIPKGERDQNEEGLACAIREFKEETGIEPNTDKFLPMGVIKQKGGKIVTAWAFEGTWVEGQLIECNTFEMEWPPRSGKKQLIPELDRAGMFIVNEAKLKINKAQVPFIERLEALI